MSQETYLARLSLVSFSEGKGGIVLKNIFRVFCLSFVLFHNGNVLFAEVTDEMFDVLNERVKRIEEKIAPLDEYYVRVDNIESDIASLSSRLEAISIEEAPQQVQKDKEELPQYKVDRRIQRLEELVDELKDRADMMDITEEIRRIQEYVCPNGHIFPAMAEDKRCPICGLEQKARQHYKLFKFARRESVSERIEAALKEEIEKRVLVGVSGTGIYQQLISSGRGEKGFAEGSFDLLFFARPLLNTTFFIDLEAIGGNGPDELIDSFSILNRDAGTLQDVDRVDRVSVREVWLQSFLLQDRLRLVGGKIDLTNYFDSNIVANDETTKFITGAFVNNPTLEVPENGPGFAAFFDTKRGLTFGLGLQSADNSGFGITDNIYAIAEAGYRAHFLFGMEGNYRIWGRINGERDDNKGLGISIDQNLSTRLTTFARYGVNESEEGEADIASAWSAGLRFRSPFFERVNDEIAFAFGMLDAVGGDRESATEFYYKFWVNKHFAVTPNLQAIFDPRGVGKEDTVMSIGIRTQIEF